MFFFFFSYFFLNGRSRLAVLYLNQPLFFDHTEFLQGSVFVDRDGKHFRHILNWLRDGVVPSLTDSEYSELLREAEYYQLLVSYFITSLATSL